MSRWTDRRMDSVERGGVGEKRRGLGEEVRLNR